MRGPSLFVSLVWALVWASACRSSEPGASQPAADASVPAAAPAASLATPPTSPPAESRAPVDPERADKLRDLDDLCKSVDHDYGDGTLGDYYHGLKLRTAWGEALRSAGLESMHPARLLEAAVKELAPTSLDPAQEEPALPHCHTLLEYIDDVE